MGKQIRKGDTHPPHTHSNNIFSALLFRGWFRNTIFDPRPQASVLQPNTTEDNFNNTSMLGFTSDKGVD